MVKGLFSAAFGLALSVSAASAQETECQTRWLQGEAAGLSYGVGFVHGTPTASVDAAMWAQMDFPAKAAMMETFICAVAGPGKTLTEAEFVSNMTNRVIGRWEMGKGLQIP